LRLPAQGRREGRALIGGDAGRGGRRETGGGGPAGDIDGSRRREQDLKGRESDRGASRGSGLGKGDGARRRGPGIQRSRITRQRGAQHRGDQAHRGGLRLPAQRRREGRALIGGDAGRGGSREIGGGGPAGDIDGSGHRQ